MCGDVKLIIKAMAQAMNRGNFPNLVNRSTRYAAKVTIKREASEKPASEIIGINSGSESEINACGMEKIG